ncbi:MAG: type IX secretion system membrane protein PorP/SprF [Cytophagaceae bacterium]
MLRTAVFFLCFLTSSYIGFAQDPQLSQYYNSPLYLNPAFAGTAENSRLIFNYRNQWPGVNSFTTYAASFDHDIQPYRSGVGLLIKRDQQGTSPLVSTDVSLLYSYMLEVNENWTFRPGIQASFVTRNTDFYNYTFGDQLTSGGHTGSGTGESFGNQRIFYPSFAAGGLLYNNNFWIGISAHHLNRPNQSFSDNVNQLPIKSSVHTGYRISLDPAGFTKQSSGTEKSITPTLMYKNQGRFDQLDLGAYLTLEPVMFGLWYRGLPLKRYSAGIQNNESLILMAGLAYEGFTFAYSFDLPLSKLNVGRSAGAHEIAIIYEWSIPYNPKLLKRGRPLPCPKFYKK